MKKFAFLFLILVGCTADGDSVKTLQNYGFTDIHTTGYSPFACGDDDNFATGFTAKNPQGRQVSGTVCCGIMKACTVRF